MPPARQPADSTAGRQLEDDRNTTVSPRQQQTATPEQLTVIGWRDPIVEARGHRPGSPYIECVWLGVIGPSTTLAWQRLARLAVANPGGQVESVDLARSLGLGDGLSRNAPISRTLARMVAFGAAARTGDTLAVRLALADVPQRQLRRLSRTAQLAHQRWGHTAAATLDCPDTPAPAVTP